MTDEGMYQVPGSLLDELRERRRHVCAAQEAPAPEGLRDVALRQARIVADMAERVTDDALMSEMMALDSALRDATPPTPAEPPRHEHRIEYPSTCTGCEHLAAAFVSSAPDWMLAGRAEARPPEGLDVAWAALRQIADLAPLGPFRVVTDELAAAQKIAREALAACLSAGGATE